MSLRKSTNLLFKKQNSGFTLVELLISSFMGIIIIGAAGFGLMHLLRGSRSNTAQVNKRTEFNRATEFISDEMRRADHIDVDPSGALTTAGITTPANTQAVLAINIPGVRRSGATDDTPIIYYVSNPASDDTSIWNGPRVIYRYGPPIDANGDFTNGAWQTEPLVDGISADAATTSCDSGWEPSPSSSAAGFYACILPGTDDPDTADDESEKGETAKIFAIGQLDETNSNSDNYQASTQVYARAERETLEGANPDVTYNGFCFVSTATSPGSPPVGALVCPPTTPGTPPSLTYSIRRISDSFACKPDGTKWKVKVTAYYLDDSDNEQYFNLAGGGTSLNVDPETTNLDFTTEEAPLFRVTPDLTNSPGCSGTDVFTSTTQNQGAVNSGSTQFKLLQDADSIPDELQNEAYLVTDTSDPNKVQKTAVQVLTEKGLVDSVQTNKVNTGKDYLVAFEIGQTKKSLPGDNDPTTPETPNPGYDFQDQIFLINVQ